MIDAAKILANLCHDDRTGLTLPMRFEVDGVTYAAATDGYAAIALRGVDVPHARGQLKAEQVFDVLAPDTIDVSVSVMMADLQAVAGPHAYGDAYQCDECNGKPDEHKRNCEPCKGTGEILCRCDCGHLHDAKCEACGGKKQVSGCDKCEGDGEVNHPSESVWMHSRWFDRRLIAEVVRDMPSDGAITITVSGDVLGLWGNGWGAVVMAMRELRKEQPAAAWPFPCEPTEDVTEWQRWLAVRRAVEAGK